MTFSIALGLVSSILKYVQAKELHALCLCYVRLKKGKEKEFTMSDTQTSKEETYDLSPILGRDVKSSTVFWMQFNKLFIIGNSVN